MYDYRYEMIENIKNYIEWNECKPENGIIENSEEFETALFDELWVADSVTGNASGSYTCNSYISSEYIIDNINLLEEAAESFGIAPTIKTDEYEQGVEWWDVTIRCYLLGECLHDALCEMFPEYYM